MLLSRVVRSYVAEDDAAGRVVGEEAFGGLGNVWVGAASDPTFLHRNKAQECARRVLLGSLCWKLEFIKCLKDTSANSGTNQVTWLHILGNILDWEDAAAVHLSLRIGEGREDQSWAINQANVSFRILQEEGLEMLGLPWHRCNSHSLSAAEDIDEAGLADIGVPDCAHVEAVRMVLAHTSGSTPKILQQVLSREHPRRIQLSLLGLRGLVFLSISIAFTLFTGKLRLFLLLFDIEINFFFQVSEEGLKFFFLIV